MQCDTLLRFNARMMHQNPESMEAPRVLNLLRRTGDKTCDGHAASPHFPAMSRPLAIGTDCGDDGPRSDLNSSAAPRSQAAVALLALLALSGWHRRPTALVTRSTSPAPGTRDELFPSLIDCPRPAPCASHAPRAPLPADLVNATRPVPKDRYSKERFRLPGCGGWAG